MKKIIIIRTYKFNDKTQILNYFKNKGVKLDVNNSTNTLFYIIDDTLLKSLPSYTSEDAFIHYQKQVHKWEIIKTMAWEFDFDELSMLIEAKKLQLL